MVTLTKRINSYRINDKPRDKDIDKPDDKQDNKQRMIEIKIKPYSTITCLGKRGTGKSFLCKWLIEKLITQGIYNTVYLFSTTEKYSHSFNCLEKEYIVDSFDIPFIMAIITAQRKRIEQYG